MTSAGNGVVEVDNNGRIQNIFINKTYRFADGPDWKRACHE